jgi:hypothetical protein
MRPRRDVVGLRNMPHTRRRRQAAGLVVTVVTVAVMLGMVDPFGSPARSSSGVVDNTYPTSTLVVAQTSLSSQTSIGGTLGFVGSTAVTIPAGTAASQVRGDLQTVASTAARVRDDRSTLAQVEATAGPENASTILAASQAVADDGTKVQAVRSQLAKAQRAKCRGTVMRSCASERISISRDETSLGEAEDALAVDRLRAGSSARSAEQTLAGDETTLSATKSALAGDEAQATNPNATFTSLPAPGRVITRGEVVFSLNDQPVPLLYGAATLYRDIAPGVGDGPDVLELERNLVALGFQHGPASDHFSAATESGLRAWQRSLDLAVTGVIRLGDIVVEPGAIRVATVTAKPGSAKSDGETVLTATSTRRAVTVNLGASQQSGVKVGDRVTVTLPDNTTTPGVVSSVGTVVSSSAATGNSDSGGSSGATINVEVRLTDPRTVAALSVGPVTVSITNASVRSALVVPVDALLALSSGGYALEIIKADGAHRLLGVTTGLFDDADGLVQVRGTGLSAGQKIVVPNS